MSYARFGWDGSDVYVYLDVRGSICCCGCHLGDQWNFPDTASMLVHLGEHKAAGDTVPDDCIERLKEEREETDARIKELRECPS